MKHVFISLIFLQLFSCCNEPKVDSVRSFIPGTYVMNYTSEFSKGKDTIRITSLSSVGNNYRIDRSTSYQRIKEGKLLPAENKKQQWICIYSDQDKVLHETMTGKVISFIPEKGKLLIGNNEYDKVINKDIIGTTQLSK